MSTENSTTNADAIEPIDIDPLSAVALPPAPLASANSPTPFASREEERLSGERLLAVIENYIQYYASGETHTARAKRYDLQYFIEFLAGRREEVPNVLVADWTLQRTKDFVDDRLDRGEAPATVARRLATIKHFGRTLAERFVGYINPAREVKGPVLQLTRPRGLSAEEIELLRDAARQEVNTRKSEFVALRDQFLLEILLATGLRADEVRSLVMSQVSEDLNWLKNVKTKGRRYRNVYVNSEFRTLFSTYLAARAEQLQKKAPLLQQASSNELARIPVLISFYGAEASVPNSFGLSPKTVFNAIANLGKKAQALSPSTIPNLHPHRLRHTFAHGLLDSSKDVRLVAQALGHSDVRTTMRYTERSDQEVASAIEKKILEPR